jgi:serine phosphatase RsbU (regulator of sigma subunit)
VVAPTRDFKAAAAAAGIGMWQWVPEDGAVIWDEITEQLFGFEPGSFPGTMEAFVDRLHPDEEMGVSGGDYSVELRVRLPDGTSRRVMGHGRVMSEDGAIAAAFGIVHDQTDRRRSETTSGDSLGTADEREGSRQDMQFAIDAGASLAGVLNLELLARRVVELVVPYIAEACIIDVTVDAPAGHCITAVKLDSAEFGPVTWATDDACEQRIGHVAGPVDDLAALATNLEVLTDYDPERKWHSQPIELRGRRIGSLIWTSSDNDERQMGLMRLVAEKAAVAFDAAELYIGRSRMSNLLVESMVPEEVDTVDGWDVATQYRASTDLTRIGGDFYDVFHVDGNGSVVAVGDVCGKGVIAAGQAALTRAALRSAGHSDPNPERILSVLNKVLLDEPSHPLVTMIVATIEGPRVRLASAGHPRAMLFGSDGGWQEVDTAGTLLGFVDDLRLKTTELSLEPGQTLLLYSDGVTEARLGKHELGAEKLAEVVSRVAGVSARAMADAAAMKAESWSIGALKDDLTVLVMKRLGDA